VADYAPDAVRRVVNANTQTPLHGRHTQAQLLTQKMATISAKTEGKTGAVILLRDDLGVTMELNALRNAETGRLGAYMAQNQRARTVGDIILGLEEAYTKNGQASEWTKRYRKHYDWNKVTRDKATFDSRTKSWDTRINQMTADVAKLNGSTQLQAYWRDFDPNDVQSAKDRQAATAAFVHGTVKTKEEQALWDRWFNEDPRDPYATLWGAVTALDADFAAFMFGKSLPDAGKLDKASDIVKNLLDARDKYREALAKRAADDALALIGVAMASQLTRLQIVNPNLYKVAGARVLIAATARTTVTVTPGFMAVTQTQEALMLAEAAFGPPQPQVLRLLSEESVKNKRVFVVGSNGVDMYAFEGSSTTTQKTRVLELWLPDEIAKELPALPAPAARLALPPPMPKVNPFAALVQFSKKAPGVLAWVGLTLQSLNLANSGKDLVDSGVSDKSDAYFGIVSGIMGVTGVMAEITAGAMERMATRYAATTIARWALAGGVLAGLSAVAEGIQAAVKGAGKLTSGDTDAGVTYLFSSVFLLASGAAALAGSLAIASSAGILTGTLGFLAGIGASAATVPVWGWIAAGVIFLGIGLAPRLHLRPGQHQVHATARNGQAQRRHVRHEHRDGVERRRLGVAQHTVL
jgi:hypothetical protein